MINLSKSGDTIVFEFVNNGHYLENGTIEVPVNSLSLVIDSSNMATFKKASSNDVFIAATYDELGMTKAELETFYKENMAGSTGGGGDITSGEVQTMIDESISGKADTSAVTESINAAVSGKQDTLSAGTGIEISGNVISATGGGATYSAGLGIDIDSADTITAIYEGYPQVDDEAKTNRLSNTTDPFYVMNTNAVSTSGATRFKFGSKNRNAIYDFAQHTVTIDGEEWPDYLTWQWSDSYNMFLFTPLQSIPSATASTISSGTTFVMPSGVTLVNSGKTTSVITDLTNKVDNIPFNTQISLNGEQVYLSYKKADGITYGSGFNVGGGLTNDNGALSTKVRKSNQSKWVDVAIGGNNNVYFDATTTVQFDLTDVPEAEVYVRTNHCESEQILDENGDVITGQTCITVTKSDNHVVVTAVDNPYAETPNSISGIEGSQAFRWYMENLQIWGYEYTTIDDAVETILSGKQDTLSAGTGIEISGNVISATGGGGIDSGTVQTMIDDSISGKADTSAVTESINAAVSGKVDTSTFETYSGSVDASLSGKQDTLSAGTGIEISGNVISATGGGGTTYSAGTNISISTANTISCTLPITVDSANNVYKFGTNTTQGLYNAFVYGYGNNFTKIDSSRFADYNIIGNNNSGRGSTLNIFGKGNTITHTNNSRGSIACTIIGSGNTSSGDGQYNNSNRTIIGNGNIISASSYSTAIGNNLVCGSANETALGRYNKSVTEDNSQTSHSGNTLFSVGNGTSNSARHNAFEIRQNGDIYITSGGTDIKLQDNLGGGGGTVSSAITSGDTNAVAGGAVYDKFDEVEQVTAAALNNLSAAFDGLKLKKLTQAQYDALAPNYDNNTLYVII